MQASYKRTKDDCYIQSLPSGDVLSFKGSSSGKRISGDSHLLWMQHFTNPMLVSYTMRVCLMLILISSVAIFDVLRKNSSAPTPHNAMVLLQPRPQLQDVLPNLTPDTTTARLPNLDSAYVGIIKETGSLYAMTPGRFPLVAFGGAERHASGRLIDPPTEDDDLLTEVDAVTRARKYKERMKAWEKDQCQGDNNDRRCLVGVRKLEDDDGHASRMKRLLDGPIDGRFPALLPGGGGAQPVEDIPTSNGTIALPTGVGSPSNGTLDAGEGWTKAARGNLWEALAVTFALGIVSLWFAVKRFRNTRNKSFAPISATKAGSLQAVEAVAAEASNDTTLPTQPLVESPTDDTPVSQLEPLPPPPVKSISPIVKSLPIPNGTAVDDGDDSEREGEGEGDVPATPGRRKARRGKRGKKKKVGVVVPEEGAEERKPAYGSAGDSGSGGSDPLPSSLVINSPKPQPSAPSLVVSETILGKFQA